MLNKPPVVVEPRNSGEKIREKRKKSVEKGELKPRSGRDDGSPEGSPRDY
jgi:hypothetical protein